MVFMCCEPLYFLSDRFPRPKRAIQPHRTVAIEGGERFEEPFRTVRPQSACEYDHKRRFFPVCDADYGRLMKTIPPVNYPEFRHSRKPGTAIA
jgi:hypothetical protein